MRRIVVVVAAALGLLASAGQATAAPGDSALELAGQAAAAAQGAGAQSGAAQSQPSNKNVSVRVLSPGDNGDVSQSNTVSSNATAANANVTGQSANQTQSGSCGCTGGTQATGQKAESSQAATALSYAKQSGASNTNIPVRVLSPGDNGNVTQSNSVESDAKAANVNATGQSAEQAAAGGSGTQAVGQDADSKQKAAAASAAEQKGAENTNISVRVLSPGKDGDVTQSNSVDSSAKAGNLNLAGQGAVQGQGGSGGTQAIGQDADNDQSAAALSAAKQDGATNRNIPVRVLSKGDGGDVTQSNSVDSSAAAGNLNATKQYADQDQGGKSKRECGCASDGIQAIGQDAKSEQSAGALSLALQSGASNTNTPVRVGSKGDDGDVTQTNSVDSKATALNVNLTGQKAGQEQGRRLPLRSRRHAGNRAEGQERPVGSGCVAGGPVRRPRSLRLWLEREHEHSRPRRQLRRRRLGRAVERRRLVGHGRQPEPDRAVRRSGAVRLWHPGHRPGGQERAGRAGRFGRAAVRRIEHEHAGACGQQGR